MRKGFLLSVGATMVTLYAKVAQDVPVTQRRVDEDDDLGLELVELLQEHCKRRSRIHVELSDDLVRLFMVEPPVGALSMADLYAAAVWRFEALYGDTVEDYVCAASWESRRPFLAAAARREVVQAVVEAVRIAGCNLGSFVPSFAKQWNQAPAGGDADQWLLFRDQDKTTIAIARSRHLCGVRQTAVPNADDSGHLEKLMLQEAVQRGLALPTDFANFSSSTRKQAEQEASVCATARANLWAFWTAPSKVHPVRIDFANPLHVWINIRAPAVAVLFCTALLMGAAGWTSSRASRLHSELEQQFSSASARLQYQERLVRSQAKPAVSDADRRTVNQAIRQLNLPWASLFDALKNAGTKTVALLAIEPDASRASINGTAESPDYTSMLDYLGQLKQQRDLADVVLLKHEINEKDPMSPLRFYFRAQWVENAR